MKQIIIITILLLSLQSCKDCCEDPTNPDCENYDPYYGKHKTSAHFIIEESLRDYWIECDTVSSLWSLV